MSNLTPFCPRCGGKLIRIKDLFGAYDDCINCGNHKDVVIGPPISLSIKRRGKNKQRTRGPSIGGNLL